MTNKKAGICQLKDTGIVTLQILSPDHQAAEPKDSIVRSNTLHPTEEAYSDLLAAFNHFNDELFDGELSQPLITLARKPKMLGAFCPNRFRNANGEIAHEIILNPHYLKQNSDIDSLSTLVHEMVHQWREDFGLNPPSKKSGGYHDAVWADRMEVAGLMPSDTGAPGGKRIGPKVSHYIIPGGAFEQAATALIERGYKIRWADRLAPEAKAAGIPPAEEAGSAPSQPKKPKDRIKFTCAACGLNAWAKPSALMKCCPCDEPLLSGEMEIEGGAA
ncbi:MAG: SprT-like domain-containing protein [Alphaproteobacteria bacterium]|nr:SprT-like domain-containing protein [Alphaproteobacteria bacterium]